MPKVRITPARTLKKKKIQKIVKGFRGRSNCYRIAKKSLITAHNKIYVDRRRKKRTIHSVWLQRIGAASLKIFNLSYSKFIYKLKDAILEKKIDKKALSYLAYQDLDRFKEVSIMLFKKQL